VCYHLHMPTDPKLMVLLKSSAIADAEPDLGETLTRTFLSTLVESQCLPARLICMGTAIFLTTEGSPMLEPLQQLSDAGVDIATCGTCLEYYHRTDMLRVGRVGNMRETIDALLSHEKVLQL